MGALTLDQLITDVEDRIDSEVATSVILKAQLRPLEQAPQLLKHLGVAVVPPWTWTPNGTGRQRYVEHGAYTLTIQAAYALPLNATDRKTVRTNALQFFKSIHTALTGDSGWARSRNALGGEDEVDYVGAHLLNTAEFTFDGTRTVGA